MGTSTGMSVGVRTDQLWLWRRLPLVLAVTAAVVLLPPTAVALLFPGVSIILGVALCVALSLSVSRVLASLWQRSPRSRDVLFVDLLLWGWVRRVRTERRLARAEELLAQGASGSVAAHIRELERISAMVEERDGYTHRHSLRVTRICEAIACKLGLSEPEIARVRTAAALHDVGKYYTPRSILNKPDRLSEAEFDVIKRHPGQGAELVQSVVEPDIVSMIRHHHERLGGSGYPDGLAGDQIPLGARIIAVADTFDAMTSNRAYRSARSHKCALDVLCEEAGVALDARCVEAFRAYYSGRRGVYWSNLFSGVGLALASARDVVVPSTLVRALPAVGASAALTVPMLAGSGVPAGAADAPTGRPAERPRVAETTPAPTPSSTPATPRRRAESASRERKTARERAHAPSRESRPAASRAGRFKASRVRAPRRREAVGVPAAPDRPEQPSDGDGGPVAQGEPKPQPTSVPEPAPEPKPRPKPPKPSAPQPATPSNPSTPPGNPTIDLPDPPHNGPPGHDGLRGHSDG